MAAYLCNRILTETLTANTADTITVGLDPRIIEVVNQDTSHPIYVRTDGTAATVAGADNYVVPPSSAAILPNAFPTADDEAAGANGADISIIGASTSTYTVSIVPVTRSV